MTDNVSSTTSRVTEKRHFKRVQDAVGLQVQRLTGGTTVMGQSMARPVIQSVRKQNKYEIEGYAVVRSDYPEVASYIDALEERIRELVLDVQGSSKAGKPTHKISLSAGGLRFSDKMLLQPGETVAITLTLFPSGRRIVTEGQIVAGKAPEVARKDLPSYRVKFVRLSDSDQQAIEEHVKFLSAKRLSMSD